MYSVLQLGFAYFLAYDLTEAGRIVLPVLSGFSHRGGRERRGEIKRGKGEGENACVYTYTASARDVAEYLAMLPEGKESKRNGFCRPPVT